jgi:tetratricopeptide (TPR) repeat protein
MFLDETMHSPFKIRGNVKIMLKGYQGALEDLDKANVLGANNAFTLKTRGDVKYLLHDYQGALKDLDKVDVLRWVIAPFILY